jgi:thiamine phosphate synthase YjbQ (UPF0047 family)
MQQYQQTLQIQTPSKSFSNITRAIQGVVTESGIKTGLCHLFIRHTSAI